MRGLAGKRVLVTGGASGIGEATAARFLEEGSSVCVLDRDQEALDRVLVEMPGLSAGIAGDVSDLADVKRGVGEAVDAMGGMDVLINNAGISIRHRLLDIQPEDWQRVLAVNLNGVFFVAQETARHMMAHDGGVILSTASTNGIMGYPFYSDYNASKAGVLELTRSMALELAPKIRVNAVAPGYILTPMQRAEYTDEMLEDVNRKLPLGRHGDVSEVAAMFAFLSSDEAEYLTGQVFIVDGGEIAGGLASR